eukprot:m.9557 g.9557  ORF g.9557 m.9557 type:complete len:629 (+) comp21431_c0_seq3:121-2007(+)
MLANHRTSLPHRWRWLYPVKVLSSCSSSFSSKPPVGTCIIGTVTLIQTSEVLPILAYSPCCSFPCKHGGICVEDQQHSVGFFCDCETTGYYGQHCETATWGTWLGSLFKPSMESIDWLRGKFPPLWYVINNVKWLRDTLQRLVIGKGMEIGLTPPQWTTLGEYKSIDTNDNLSYFAMVLPPVPKDCRTVVGSKGPKVMPAIDEIVEKLFKRKKFSPDPHHSSLLLPVYGQHFSHQFLKTLPPGDNPSLTWSGHHADTSHIYGHTLERQAALREHKDGRMKTQIIKGEEWPPSVKDAPVDMIKSVDISEEENFALGHPFFGLFPGLLAFSTIWIREHNRVVALLRKDHPNWDDERLYQTARMINFVTQIRITVNEYVVQLGGGYFKFVFDPVLMHGTGMPFGSNRISAEFNLVYHWHPILPDVYRIGDTDYPEDNVTLHVGPLLKHGLGTFFGSVSKQISGHPYRLNFGKQAQEVAKGVLHKMRHMRVQPLNRYRELMGFRPFTSFEEMTGEKELAKIAEEMYGDIDAVEFYPGIILEGRKETPGGLFSETWSHLGVTCAMQGIFSDAILSPTWWRPSTFGGKIGWKMVNTESTLQELICRNLKGECPHIAFSVPDDYVDPHRKARDEL